MNFMIIVYTSVLWMTSFTHNGANARESKATRMFRQVRQMEPPGASTCHLRLHNFRLVGVRILLMVRKTSVVDDGRLAGCSVVSMMHRSQYFDSFIWSDL